MAFGHNILTSSLQLLRAYAVLVNGGHLVKPTLVRKIVRTSTEEVLLDYTKGDLTAKFPQVLNPSIAKQVATTMKYTTKLGGSGRRADVRGYTDGGKTSTAKKIVNGLYSEKLYLSSFIGFTPAENPAFLLLVSIDEPAYGYIPGLGLNHHGGTAAAPVFREIAERSLSYFRDRL